MNYFLKATLGLFTASLFLISCNNDDSSNDDSSTDNNISFDGTEYDLSQGYVLHYDDDMDSLSFYQLTLYSSSFEITYDDDAYIDDITGEGQTLSFEINSSTSDDIALGTYTYSAHNSSTAGTFSYATASTYSNFETDELNSSEITDGTLTISKNGSSYTLSFDLTDEDGVSVTGYYSGLVEYIDYEDDLEATAIQSAKKSFSIFQK
jgi:hypothetical protein